MRLPKATRLTKQEDLQITLTLGEWSALLSALLLQSAHNPFQQHSSPLHQWGWKLPIRKHRNIATAALERKLTVAIWQLLMGNYSPIQEASKHLEFKLFKIATVIGVPHLRNMGFKNRKDFLQHQLHIMQLSS